MRHPFTTALDRASRDRIRKTAADLGYELHGETFEALVCQLEQAARERGEESMLRAMDTKRESEKLPALEDIEP